jgi:phage tail tape-measure protein
MGQPSKPPAAAALAAIEMCESLLLTRIAKGVLTRDEAVQTLEVVVGAKRALADEHHSSDDAEAATLVSEMIPSAAADSNNRAR